MNETRKERGMRNDPVDMGKLIKALEVSMIHDLPITLVPREAKKLRGELRRLMKVSNNTNNTKRTL